MKKLMFLFFIAALFAACEKDDTGESLEGTTWTTTVPQVHTEDGIDYPYDREITVSFNSDTQGTFSTNSPVLSNGQQLGAVSMNFTYTYNGSSGTAIFEPNNNRVPFTVSGNILRMTVELQPGVNLSLELTKK